MLRCYGDREVQAFAYRKDLALLLPFHCRSQGYEDMDVDPYKGLGRVLFLALSQVAQASGHKDLESGKLILLCFSGTGFLVARLAAYAPDRVLSPAGWLPDHRFANERLSFVRQPDHPVTLLP